MYFHIPFNEDEDDTDADDQYLAASANQCEENLVRKMIRIKIRIMISIMIRIRMIRIMIKINTWQQVLTSVKRTWSEESLTVSVGVPHVDSSLTLV